MKFIDPTRDGMQSIRDIVDARGASDMFFSKQAEHVRKHGPVSPSVGAGRRYPRTGQTSAGGYGNGGCVSPRVDDPRCTDQPDACGATILGFNSLFGVTANGVFPLAGANATAGITVNAGNAGKYRARELFWEARDAASGFAVAPSLLTSALISGSEQLSGTGAAFGITSAVFALTNEPLVVNWTSWSNSGQQQLTMQYVNYLAAGVTLQIFGVFWGDRMPDPTGGNG